MTSLFADQNYLTMSVATTDVEEQQGDIPGVSALFNTSSLVCWAWQVAEGMSYLAQRKVSESE